MRKSAPSEARVVREGNLDGDRYCLESLQRLSLDVLHCLNNADDTTDTIKEILRLIKDATGFDAVGIRLRKDEDFPYHAQEGFSVDFLRTENSLVIRDGEGSICRDDKGAIIPACTCGLVLSGGTDPSDPLFTDYGSAWTNDSLPLLDLPPESDPRIQPRNRCIHDGYRSVALIPIRDRRDIVGLLQLNDRRKELFTLDKVRFFEGLGESIGVALKRSRRIASLGESERQLKSALRLAGMGSWELDIAKNRLSWSETIFDLFEIDPRLFDASYDAFLAAIHPDDREAVNRAYTDSLKTRQPYEIEHRLLMRDGRVKWVKEACRTEYDPEDRPVRSVGMVLDITERRLREESLRESHDQLEQRVQERTRELSVAVDILKKSEVQLRQAAEKEREQREQLVQTAKMASLGILISGVAHEINNPNNFIMLNTPILRQVWESARPILDEYRRRNGDFKLGGINYSRMSEKVPQLFDGIDNGARRIKNIVADLKNYARKDSEGLKEPVDVNEVARAAVSLMHDMITKATSRFSFTPARRPVTIRGNMQRLEQVIINLLQNGCDALDSKEKSLALSIVTADAECIVSVSDEGNGVAPGNLGSLTDPFFTTKRERGGTGLGLSVSDGIVKDHGGRLEFESAEGRGTTARIILPMEPCG